MPELTIRPSIGADEYPALVAIWRSAVDATHGFVHESHRDEIEAHLASEYLPSVALSVAEIGGLPVGFAGTLDGNLEMLFVDAARRGDGIGSAAPGGIRGVSLLCRGRRSREQGVNVASTV